MQPYAVRLANGLTPLIALFILSSLPSAFAQSSQAAAEWGLFNQILIIGIIVGVVVFGLLFYAIIRFREKPQTSGVN